VTVSWPSGNDGPMTGSGSAGLVLTPGASARRDHSGLEVIEQAVSNIGVAVERNDFPGPAAGKRRPDSPAVCIATSPMKTIEAIAQPNTSHPDASGRSSITARRRKSSPWPMLDLDARSICGRVNFAHSFHYWAPGLHSSR
jgi:predicted alpha/beta-hydrolase family hydrolase